MADIVSAEVRSRMMSKIRSRDTKPEMLIRKALHAAGFRFRVTAKGLPNRPDLLLARYNAAIFVHGCFWHRHSGCRFCTTPKTNPQFWEAKFKRNVERDEGAVSRLIALGWRVGVVWECGLKNNPVATVDSLSRWIKSKRTKIELPAPKRR